MRCHEVVKNNSEDDMKTKMTVISFIMILFVSGCGLQQSENDRLKSENERLTKELDEYKFGAERLVSLVKKAYDEKDYESAKQNIELLRSKHPESSKNAEFGKLLKEIEKRIAEQKKKSDTEEKERIRLANIDNLGIWIIKHYVDDFGEPTKQGYVSNLYPIEGKFSNSATQDSKLNVTLLVTNSSDISIKLYEYARNNPVKGYASQGYSVKIKDCKGNRYSLSATNYSDRLSFDPADSKRVHNILLKGGQVQFWIGEDRTSTTQYQFIIDNADWYNNAYKGLSRK